MRMSLPVRRAVCAFFICIVNATYVFAGMIQTATTTTVVSSADPSVYSQMVTFTATVSPNVATGTVNFYDNGVLLGSGSLSGGTATFSTSSLSYGDHVPITASYVGNVSYLPSSGALSNFLDNRQRVNQAPSVSSVLTDIPTSTYGQLVTITATVAPNAPATAQPTGNVNFTDGISNLGNANVDGTGHAVLQTAAMTAGSRQIFAYFTSNSINFADAQVSSVPQTINKASTTSTLTVDFNPSVFSQTVTFTQTVSVVPPGGGTPTGSVTLNSNLNPFATHNMTGGVATFNVGNFLANTYAISGDYPGDSNFNGNHAQLSSNGGQWVVGNASSTTTVTSSANPAVFGQLVTLSATTTSVAPATAIPGGVFRLFDGANQIDSQFFVNPPPTTFATSTLSVGTHHVQVNFDGDTRGINGSSGVVAPDQVINKANTTTDLQSSANPQAPGVPVTFTATVSAVAPGAGMPTGSVSFKVNDVEVGTGNLSDGVAQFTTSSLGLGNYTITTGYVGDGNFNGSTSLLTGNPQVIAMVNPAVTLTSSVNPATFSVSNVTFTATVSAVGQGLPTPTGSVAFFDGGNQLGTGMLDVNGVATYSTTSLSPGPHTITATYFGDAVFNSVGASLTGNPQIIRMNSAMTLTSSLNPSLFGSMVVFTATVTAPPPGMGTPTGTVSFFDGAALMDTKPLSGGMVQLSTSILPVGNHTITATYNGDALFFASTGPLTGNPQVVSKANSTMSVVCDVNPAVAGQLVTFTANLSAVTGNGTPTGEVTFLDNGVPMGMSLLMVGQTRFFTSSLAVGNHTITATYEGDADFNGSGGSLTGNPEVIEPATTNLSWAGSIVARGDFNGDGKADILLRDANGNLGMWLMNGATIIGGAFVGSPGAGYTVAGIGDFNGDGKADILLRDTNGNIGMWLMNGSAIAGGAFVGSPGAGYTVAGIGDFNGDGKADILLRDTNGNIGMWLMNGSTITSGGFVGSPGAGYSVAAVGDFNGDGMSDILLRDTNGNLGMWIMNGAVITSGGFVGSPGAGYSVAGVADFNGDGKADILLRDTNGNIGMWIMNGPATTSGAFVGSPGGYTVVAVRDYSGDGKADILLRDVNGSVGMWMMNGSVIAGGGFVGSPGGTYTEY